MYFSYVLFVLAVGIWLSTDVKNKIVRIFQKNDLNHELFAH